MAHTHQQRELVMPLRMQEAGLPEGSVVQIIYSPTARKTLVEVEQRGAPPVHRLYWRPIGMKKYTPLGNQTENHALENAVGCEAPWIFARHVEWVAKGRAFGARTVEVVRIDLTNDPLLEPLNAQDMLPPNATVHRILRASDSGTSLTAVLLFKERQSTGVTRARYAICTLNLQTGQTVERDTLQGIQF